MYAKQIGITLAVIAISSSIYAMSLKSPEERMRDAIILQNQAIEELNSAKLESYLEIKRQCEDTASGSSREILEQLTQCSKMEKPNLQELLQVPGDSGSGVNAQTTDSKDLSNRGTASGAIVPPPERLDRLHERVCEKQINSPLCKDRALFNRLYHITEERLPNKQFFPIMLGIINAESSLGINFAKDRVGGTCYGRNNWGGIKWKINDDGTRQFSNNNKFGYDYKKKGTDDYGCWLYPFDSIDDYFISKVNTFRFYYKGCIDHKTPIWCISGPYVGKRNVHEQSWINNVSVFLN